MWRRYKDLPTFLSVYQTVNTHSSIMYTCVINSRSYCCELLSLSSEHSILALAGGLSGLVIVSVQSSPLSRFACQRGAYGWERQTTLPFLLNHHKRVLSFCHLSVFISLRCEGGHGTGGIETEPFTQWDREAPEEMRTDWQEWQTRLGSGTNNTLPSLNSSQVAVDQQVTDSKGLSTLIAS